LLSLLGFVNMRAAFIGIFPHTEFIWRVGFLLATALSKELKPAQLPLIAVYCLQPLFSQCGKSQTR
jgi:hypothetical protein